MIFKIYFYNIHIFHHFWSLIRIIIGHHWFMHLFMAIPKLFNSYYQNQISISIAKVFYYENSHTIQIIFFHAIQILFFHSIEILFFHYIQILFFHYIQILFFHTIQILFFHCIQILFFHSIQILFFHSIQILFFNKILTF